MIIVNIPVRIKVREVVPTMEERIDAKHRLWDFIHDIKKTIIDWDDTDVDLASQIITASLTILHPHFTGIEIDREIRNLYLTLNLTLPSGYMNLFSDLFCKHVHAKIKAMVK